MVQSAKEVMERDADQQFGPIIGSSEAMNNVMKIVNKVSVTDANILILGENGIGHWIFLTDGDRGIVVPREINRTASQPVHTDTREIAKGVGEWMVWAYTRE